MSESQYTPEDNKKSHFDPEMPFLSHLIELRNRLMHSLLAVLVLFLLLFPFANPLFEILSAPLQAELSGEMIAVKVADPFLTPLKLTLVLAIFLAVPYLLYQVWSFIAPGLYKHEKALFKPLLVSSTLLFYLGMAFAYFVVFPLIFRFFVGTAPAGVEVATDIGYYLDFVLKLFFAFGIAFEVPVLTVLLIWTGMTTPESLAQKRAYIIVGSFVVGMLLTPPDMFSQILLAIPMWLLFELGLILSRHLMRKKAAAEAAADSHDESREMTETEMDAELDRLSAEDEELGRKG